MNIETIKHWPELGTIAHKKFKRCRRRHQAQDKPALDDAWEMMRERNFDFDCLLMSWHTLERLRESSGAVLTGNEYRGRRIVVVENQRNGLVYFATRCSPESGGVALVL